MSYPQPLRLHFAGRFQAAVFNGTPGNLDTAIGLMMSVRQQAKDMVSGLCTDGASVGPNSEYQLVNPYRL